MSLRLYDTATRAVRDFVPLQPGRVGIYLCGATVQAPPHVGHIRSGVAFDVLQRWLLATGHEVTFIRNVTDIDDKIIAHAEANGEPWWALALRNERAFSLAYDLLGCAPPTYEPRATGHVPEMVALMQRLCDSGHAYPADGDVYFEVTTYPQYGALSGQRLADMQPAADADPRGKRDPRDFALWKAAKPGEPSWDTPWGPGRPGWHLECSAMAHKYLGATFDIHGGGLDLVFPHHENEIAQSVAAGDPFARYWLHNAWVTTAGEKMSKSLGNSLLVTEVVQRVRPVELRYYLVAAHYRSMIEYSEAALAEAAAGYQRLENFVLRAVERTGPVAPVDLAGLPAEFVTAMDDDLGVPAALAVLHGAVRTGFAQLEGEDLPSLAASVAAVRGMLGVLGLDPLASPWLERREGSAAGEAALRSALDTLVQAMLTDRAEARARKDYPAADGIRDRLAAAGVTVEDTPHGARWSVGSGGAG